MTTLAHTNKLPADVATETATELAVEVAGDVFDELLRRLATPVPAWFTAACLTLAALAVLTVTLIAAHVARRARGSRRHRLVSTFTAGPDGKPATAQTDGPVGSPGARLMIAVAIAAAVAVAGLGGVRSFDAVSDRFGSALVPLTADGMIIACTALRLAALSRGWRLPGSLITTYAFIGGTVWLNVAAAQGWTDAIAHALAPISYAVLVEMLAHMLRLHLRLAQPSRPRVTALTWVTSPVVTTRVWLHMARTGQTDPVATRALVQQLIRMSSRLHAVCPNRFDRRPDGSRWSNLVAGLSGPLGGARSARSAALQTIRDGVLSAAELAALLPVDGTRLDPGALLTLVDRAALTRTPTPTTVTAQIHAPFGVTSGALTSASTSAVNGATTSARLSATHGAPSDAGDGASSAALDAVRHATEHGTDGAHEVRRNVASDDDLVADLRRYAAVHNGGQPLTQRHVMRVLGVGTPKAKRLTEIAWPPAHGPSENAAATVSGPASPSRLEAEANR